MPQNILIEENDKTEAGIMAKSFAGQDIQNRVYTNTLGAQIAQRYLEGSGVNVSGLRNIHSIRKVLEEFDIADIILDNIHIDVRVVNDENEIFIPKSHFEYNVVPDIYLVFVLRGEFESIDFLGFFNPTLINKNNEEGEYYFIEKEKLTAPENLKEYIDNFAREDLAQEDFEDTECVMVSMIDNDIDENDKKYLLQQLSKSIELRDKFIEFENFELLSYRTANKETAPVEWIPVDETPAAIDEMPVHFDEIPQMTLNAVPLDEMPVISDETPSEPIAPTAAEVIALDNAKALEELLGDECVTSAEEGFGNSLMENLTAENFDNIKIEGVETKKDESDRLSFDEISNEIDYLLNIKDEEDSMDEEDLENLPEISGIFEDETDAAQDKNMPKPSALEVLFEENQLAQEIPAYTREQEFSETDSAAKISKKTLIAAAAAVAILTGAAGITALTKIKHNKVQPVPQPPAPVSVQEENAPTAEPVVSTNIASATPQELKQTAASINPVDGYVSVEKLVWEVPEQLSTNEGFKNYLNSAGKSIKLSLTSDLLLATEFPTKNSVKVKIQLSSSGDVNSANIASSSGSDEIDKIVLQSVKDTLGVLKPPSGVIKDAGSQLGITISF